MEVVGRALSCVCKRSNNLALTASPFRQYGTISINHELEKNVRNADNLTYMRSFSISMGPQYFSKIDFVLRVMGWDEFVVEGDRWEIILTFTSSYKIIWSGKGLFLGR